MQISATGKTASFIMLSITTSERSRVDQSAKQLLEDFHYARDLALMRYTLVGWQVNQSGYQFALRNTDGRWIAYQSRALPQRTWHEALQLEGLAALPQVLQETTAPALIFFPSGDMTPLSLKLRLGDAVRGIRVKSGQFQLVDIDHES